jgi:hypothetical protein
VSSLAADLDRYLARNGWVTMRQIKADLALDWDDAQKVWTYLLPGLEATGFIERREGAGPRQGAAFRASAAFAEWVNAEPVREPAAV